MFALGTTTIELSNTQLVLVAGLFLLLVLGCLSSFFWYRKKIKTLEKAIANNSQKISSKNTREPVEDLRNAQEAIENKSSERHNTVLSKIEQLERQLEALPDLTDETIITHLEDLFHKHSAIKEREKPGGFVEEVEEAGEDGDDQQRALISI